jgi:hypothetical protein
MPLALWGLLLAVMVAPTLLPPPLLAPAASLLECAEPRRCCWGWPMRWLMKGRNAAVPCCSSSKRDKSHVQQGATIWGMTCVQAFCLLKSSWGSCMGSCLPADTYGLQCRSRHMHAASTVCCICSPSASP